MLGASTQKQAEQSREALSDEDSANRDFDARANAEASGSAQGSGSTAPRRDGGTGQPDSNNGLDAIR